MSFVLSLLIFLPIIGAPIVYLLTRSDKKWGVSFSAAFAFLIFMISAYVFWAVFSNTPGIGQYALTESYGWVNFQFLGLNYLVGTGAGGSNPPFTDPGYQRGRSGTCRASAAPDRIPGCGHGRFAGPQTGGRETALSAQTGQICRRAAPCGETV